jgi:hypothetical protein
MAISVKQIRLWRAEVEDRPGSLARTLEPLAGIGASLQVVMSYHMGTKAAVEVFPVSGKKAAEAARRAGLSESGPPALLVSGDDRPGIGHAIARATADAGININFMMAQVVGGRFSAIFGFGSEDDALRAAALIRKAGSKKAASRR